MGLPKKTAKNGVDSDKKRKYVNNQKKALSAKWFIKNQRNIYRESEQGEGGGEAQRRLCLILSALLHGNHHHRPPPVPPSQ